MNKTKLNKILITSIGMIFIILFVGQSVSADVNISSIDYPETVLQGEIINVTVYFEYTDTHASFITRPYVFLFYSINSLTVDDEDMYVSTPVVSGSRPVSVSFALPVSTIESGDTLRFRIMYDYLIQNVGLYSVISDIYRIDIAKSIDETTTEPTDKTGISMIGFGIILFSLTVRTIKRKRVELK